MTTPERKDVSPRSSPQASRRKSRKRDRDDRSIDSYRSHRDRDRDRDENRDRGRTRHRSSSRDRDQSKEISGRARSASSYSSSTSWRSRSSVSPRVGRRRPHRLPGAVDKPNGNTRGAHSLSSLSSGRKSFGADVRTPFMLEGSLPLTLRLPDYLAEGSRRSPWKFQTGDFSENARSEGRASCIISLPLSRVSQRPSFPELWRIYRS